MIWKKREREEKVEPKIEEKVDDHLYKIAVVGIGEKAGATTIASVIAYELGKSKMPTYFVANSNLDEIFLNPELGNKKIYRNVVWKAKTEDIRDLKVERGVIIYDEPDLETLEEFDVIVGVIDPLPEKLMGAASVYNVLYELEKRKEKVRNCQIIWLVNKYNSGVNMAEVERFLKQKFKHFQPHIGPERVYAFAYSNIPIFEMGEFEKTREFTQHIVEIL